MEEKKHSEEIFVGDNDHGDATPTPIPTYEKVVEENLMLKVENAALKNDRDSARHHVLRLLDQFNMDAHGCAKKWGWDYLKYWSEKDNVKKMERS